MFLKCVLYLFYLLFVSYFKGSILAAANNELIDAARRTEPSVLRRRDYDGL